MPFLLSCANGIEQEVIKLIEKQENTQILNNPWPRKKLQDQLEDTERK